MSPFLPCLPLNPNGRAYVSLGIQSRKWAHLISSISPFLFAILTTKSPHALLWMLQFACEMFLH